MFGFNSVSEENYICINCGHSVKSLFRKYSTSVLKLTQCDNCNTTADKYIEYDVVITIIDLVLLQKAAYRHVLHNVNFKTFWKLFVILILMEAYSDLMRQSPYKYNKGDVDKPFLHEFDEMSDFLFYKLCLNATLKTLSFLIVIFLLTWIYRNMSGKSPITFLQIWKLLTVSSFGTFLLLPSLIWDNNVQEFHICVVSLYTTLAQLLAYTVTCKCSKLWSIVCILSAYYCKIFCLDFLNYVIRLKY